MDINKIVLGPSGEQFYPLDYLTEWNFRHTTGELGRCDISFILPNDIVEGIEGRLKQLYVRID